MKFDTKSGYGFMHLYLTLHPKKSPAYDPTEEGYIFDEAESRLHHFAEFIRFNEKLAAEGNAIRAELFAGKAAEAGMIAGEGWQDFTSHFTKNVNGEIEFDKAELRKTFGKFISDVRRICSRPHSQLEIELAKSMGK